MALESALKTGQRIVDLEARLQALRQERDQADEGYNSGEFARKQAYDKSIAELKARLQVESERHRAEVVAHGGRVAARYKRRNERADRAFNLIQNRILKDKQTEKDRTQKELTAAQDQISEEDKEKGSRLSQEHDQIVSEISSLREKTQHLKAHVESLAGSLGHDLDETAARKTDPADTKGDPHAILEKLTTTFSEVGVAYATQKDSLLLAFGRKSWTVMSFILVALTHACAFFFVIQQTTPGTKMNAYMYISISLAFFLVFVQFLTRVMRAKAIKAVTVLYGNTTELLSRLVNQEQAEKDRFWAESRELLDNRVSKVLALEKKIHERSVGKRDALDKAFAHLRRRYQRIKDYLNRTGDKAEQDVQKSTGGSAQALAKRQDAERKAVEDEHAAVRNKAQAVRDQIVQRASASWKESLESITTFAKSQLSESDASSQDWATLAGPEGKMASAFPTEVRLGTVDLALKKLEIPEDEAFTLPLTTISFPLTLTFPTNGSLLIQAGGTKRDHALEILFNSALRVLASFPPGMAKLTVVDPVGLGQGFSALMDLADHDETLINGRIWTESGHIEKRLSELTEHMEKVIQKYLRNRYATISEYNVKAGEMKEPYQFLILSDFPSGVSDLALERLSSIVSSGARCGVHVLMYHDTRQRWPSQVDVSLLKRNGVVLKEHGDEYRVDQVGLKRGACMLEKPPEKSRVSAFLAKLGKEAIAANRVELSFMTVAPSPAEIWSRSTEKTIRIPIGRSGATKLQEMELGKGTAQHALIAGRTGSGKSTLFHVMITNMALWFGPEEVEYYLIDFKKGVEFKTYADNKLPHARVIAIESDREFGLSVLRRLDEELTKRGELFRAAGVQDLASYRRTPNAIPMPRTLLLIDEFQEYFTVDDAVSQDASLLLDRFVRQGRAFGVHLILGSQTLSGVYTLAKSTLGQMGVRIALQCNESDSYLILSEDNAAARLLSRPGEAIYNDMSGLVEGNNPFQVVWLTDDEKYELVRDIASRADVEKRRPAASTVVFEGNAPARLESNVLLKRCFEEGRATVETTQRVWLGEPNAIKGPTEAKFVPNGGSHLLMMGQRHEAAFGMTCSTILSLASRMPIDKLRFLVLDGSGADSEEGAYLQRLAQAIPHQMDLVPFSEVPKAIDELSKAIKAAQESGEALQQHTYVMIYGLQKFRALRQEDDFSMSFGSEEGGANTGQQFADILKDGPEQNIHMVVWVDTLANANRSISRKTMREFDQRILFQMSAADSSELIDSPVANNLGLHTALMFVESDGLLEKFRPYALPDAGWLKTVQMALHARFHITVKSR